MRGWGGEGLRMRKSRHDWLENWLRIKRHLNLTTSPMDQNNTQNRQQLLQTTERIQSDKAEAAEGAHNQQSSA